MERLPCVALDAMVNVAVIWVLLTTARPVTVIPAPALMDVAPVRLVPVRVTDVLRPAGLDAGEMLLSVGTIPKVTALLVPFGFVTEMLVVVAFAGMLSVAVICVLLTGVKPETVIPPP